MAGVEEVATVSYIKELAEKQAKTHKEVSEILRQRYPGIEGLSERSARRYCATNNVQRHDSGLTSVDLNNVVASAITRVRVCINSTSSQGLLLNDFQNGGSSREDPCTIALMSYVADMSSDVMWNTQPIISCILSNNTQFKTGN